MKVKLDKNIQEFLEEFSLSEREIVIYLTLLKTGPNTIMNLARDTGIKRSTTHNNVEELIKKGLVSQTNYGERRMVVAEEPDKLKFLLDQKKWNIKKVEENLPNVVDAINKMIPDAKSNSQVDVKYYEGREGIEYVYNQMLKANKVYSFVNLEKYYELFPNTVSQFKKALEENNDREVWSIIINSEVAKDIAKNKHERYYPKFLKEKVDVHQLGFNFGSYDDKLILVQLEKDNLIGIVIDSPIIASTFKIFHQTTWSLLDD